MSEKIERNVLSAAVKFKLGNWLINHKDWVEIATIEQIQEKLLEQFGGSITHKNVIGLLKMCDIEQKKIEPTTPENDIKFVAALLLKTVTGQGLTQNDFTRLEQIASK